MSTTKASKVTAVEKGKTSFASVTNINGANSAFSMSKFEKELLGLAKEPGKIAVAPVESKGWETMLVSRAKPKAALSKIIKAYKVQPRRKTTHSRLDLKRAAARREDAIEFRLGWTLEDVEEYLAMATPLELDEIEEVIEEVIEDAVLADLGNEPRIMFAHNA